MFSTFSTNFYHNPLAFVPISSAVLMAPSFSSPLVIFSETVVKARLPYSLAALPTENAFVLAYSISS
jgi:hypothetical protein